MSALYLIFPLEIKGRSLIVSDFNHNTVILALPSRQGQKQEYTRNSLCSLFGIVSDFNHNIVIPTKARIQ